MSEVFFWFFLPVLTRKCFYCSFFFLPCTFNFVLRVRCLWSIVLYCAALCDNALGVGSNSTGAVGFFFRGGV